MMMIFQNTDTLFQILNLTDFSESEVEILEIVYAFFEENTLSREEFSSKAKTALEYVFLSMLKHQLKMICICLNKELLKIFKSTMNGTNNNAQSLNILV